MRGHRAFFAIEPMLESMPSTVELGRRGPTVTYGFPSARKCGQLLNMSWMPTASMTALKRDAPNVFARYEVTGACSL